MRARHAHLLQGQEKNEFVLLCYFGNCESVVGLNGEVGLT